MTLSVVIAAYDEAPNIAPLTERLIRTLDAAAPGRWELIYVIEGTDKTFAIAQSFAATRPEIRLFYHPHPSGLGAAFRRGFAAIRPDADAVITMDADLNHQPEEIPALLAVLEQTGAHLVIGSRNVAGASSLGIPVWKRQLSKFGNRVMRRRIQASIGDQTSGFRVYRAAALRNIRFTNDGFAFLPEILACAQALGFQIVEAPIRFIYRVHGRSKMNIVETSLSYLSFLRRRPQPAPPPTTAAPDVPGVPGPGHWDHHWSSTDRGRDSLFGRGAAFVRRNVFQPAVAHYLEKYFPAEGVFCEMGCGTGESSLALPGRKRRFVGLDYSANALARAGAAGRFHQLLCADVSQLPLRPGSLDGIWNLGVLEHFPNAMLAQTMREFARVLKPGGVAVLFWPPEYNSSRWLLGPMEWLRSQITRRPFRFFPDEISRLKSKREAENFLRDAGLQPVEIDFSMRTCLIHTVVVGRKP